MWEDIMKTSSKIIGLLTLTTFAYFPALRADETPAPPAAATSHPHYKEMRERRMKRLDEKLVLTADQRAQINAIWDKTEGEVRAARENSALSVDERRAQRREAMKVAHQQVRSVLTPEQQVKFDQLPVDRPGAGHESGQERKAN
jgi:Spy/CpxP family protein refolding chaperone